MRSRRKMAMGVVQYGGIPLVLLVLVVVLVSVFPRRGTSGVGLQHRDTRSVAACQVNGTTYANGSTFTLASGGSCQRYQCNGGQYHAISSAGCSFNGQCVDVNSTVQHQCSNYTCSQHNVSGLTQYNMSITTVGCSFNGQCVDVNSTVQHQCSNYTCSQHNVSGLTQYNMSITSVGCELDGECQPENYTYTENCRKMQCQQYLMTTGFFTIQEGCQFDEGCLNVNETMEDRCSNFTCVEDITNGFKDYYINVTKIGASCMDTSGTCHNLEDWFTDRSLQCICIGVDDVICPED